MVAGAREERNRDILREYYESYFNLENLFEENGLRNQSYGKGLPPLFR